MIVYFFRNIAILSYCTNSLNAANLGKNAYVNNIIGNVIEILAFASTTVVLRNFGRKATLIFAMVAFGCSFIATPLAKQSKIVDVCIN